jgi:hypothetical protein
LHHDGLRVADGRSHGFSEGAVAVVSAFSVAILSSCPIVVTLVSQIVVVSCYSNVLADGAEGRPFLPLEQVHVIVGLLGERSLA